MAIKACQCHASRMAKVANALLCSPLALWLTIVTSQPNGAQEAVGARIGPVLLHV